MKRNPSPYTTEKESPAELLSRHGPLVKRIAHHLLARLPEHIQLDDLVQAGLEGLLEASRNFKPGMGASFETFAGIRIRGAMLDEIRRGDWSPRSVHRNARALAESFGKLEAQLGRAPHPEEQAAALEIPLADYHDMARNALSVQLQSLDESINEQGMDRLDFVEDDQADPADQVEDINLRERLASAIGELPERDQLLLSLYYKEELNLKEIGKVLGVSESRVSQLHSQAALKLRSKLIEK